MGSGRPIAKRTVQPRGVISADQVTLIWFFFLVQVMGLRGTLYVVVLQVVIFGGLCKKADDVQASIRYLN